MRRGTGRNDYVVRMVGQYAGMSRADAGEREGVLQDRSMYCNHRKGKYRLLLMLFILYDIYPIFLHFMGP